MDPAAEMGPLVTRAHCDKVRGYVDTGVAEGAKLVVDGRGLKVEGHEQGFFLGGCLFDDVQPGMRIYDEEIFGPVLSVVRADDFEAGAARWSTITNSATACAIFTRDGDAAREFAQRVQIGMVGDQRADPGADGLPLLRRLEGVAVRRSPHARPRGGALLHALQGGDAALADGDPCGRRVRDADDEASRAGIEAGTAARAWALLLVRRALLEIVWALGTRSASDGFTPRWPPPDRRGDRPAARSSFLSAGGGDERCLPAGTA